MNNSFTNFLKEAAMIRRSGQTTWLLKSALNNSNCILVFANHRIKSDAMRLFNEMKQQAWNDLPFYKKWVLNKDKWVKQRQPIFKTVCESIIGYKSPVFFDNSCFPLIYKSA